MRRSEISILFFKHLAMSLSLRSFLFRRSPQSALMSAKSKSGGVAFVIRASISDFLAADGCYSLTSLSRWRSFRILGQVSDMLRGPFTSITLLLRVTLLLSSFGSGRLFGPLPFILSSRILFGFCRGIRGLLLGIL